MIKRIAEKIVAWLIEYEVVEKENRELYEYAAFCLISKVLPFLVVIPFCIITKTIINGVILVAVFMSVRKYAGGYHAKTPMRCFVYSCIILSAFIWISDKLRNRYALLITLLISVIFLNVYSPVESENKKLESIEKIKYKGIVRKLLTIYEILFIALTVCGMDKYAVCVALGLILSAILQMLAVLNFQKRKNDKKVRIRSFRT